MLYVYLFKKSLWQLCGEWNFHVGKEVERAEASRPIRRICDVQAQDGNDLK